MHVKHEYTKAHDAFVHFIQPYCNIYMQVLLPLLKVSEMIEGEDHRSLGSCPMSIESLKELLQEVFLFCEDRMFHSVSWVKFSATTQCVPTVDENSDKVDPLSHFATAKRDKIEFVLANMQKWGLPVSP
jgi:hypothetical protein